MYLFITVTIQCISIAYTVELTLCIAAAFSIIDAIAVADVEAVLRAVFPDRPLHKAWKGLRIGTVEFSRVDPLRDRCDDLGAAAGPVAGRAIGMAGIEPLQNAGAMQEIVHEACRPRSCWLRPRPRHVAAGRRETGSTAPPSAPCQRRRRLPSAGQGPPSASRQAGPVLRLSGGLQAPVEPAHEITIGDITNEQIEGKGCLIEPAIAQPMLGQRALREVLGLGAGVVLLAVSAATTVRLTPRRVLERTDLAGACCRKWAVSI